jgi:hypothetical protein
VGKVDACFGPFGGSVNVGKIVEWSTLNVPQAWKCLWAHPLELLGDVGPLEACFSLFGHCVNLDTRYMHGLRQT